MSKTNALYRKSFIYIISIFLTALVIGCNSSPTGPIPDNSLNMQNAANLGLKGNGPLDFISIKNAQVILKKVELLPSPAMRSTGEDQPIGVLNSPELVKLDLNSSNNIISLKNIKPGVYYGVKFIIAGITDNITPNPSPISNMDIPNKEYSLIVNGSFGESAFTFKTRNTFEQVVYFSNPISLKEIGRADVTLKVNPYQWFKKDGIYLDPNDHQNYAEINQLIALAFKKVMKESRLSITAGM